MTIPAHVAKKAEEAVRNPAVRMLIDGLIYTNETQHMTPEEAAARAVTVLRTIAQDMNAAADAIVSSMSLVSMEQSLEDRHLEDP